MILMGLFFFTTGWSEVKQLVPIPYANYLLNIFHTSNCRLLLNHNFLYDLLYPYLLNPALSLDLPQVPRNTITCR